MQHLWKTALIESKYAQHHRNNLISHCLSWLRTTVQIKATLQYFTVLNISYCSVWKLTSIPPLGLLGLVPSPRSGTSKGLEWNQRWNGNIRLGMEVKTLN